MPLKFSDVLPSAIGGVGSIVGGVIDAAVTGAQNRKSRQFAREMYSQQRLDNVAFWNLQNEYNTPLNQMARLKAAGLNPNLVYGQSAGGAAGQAGSLSAPSAMGAQFRPSSIGSAIGRAGELMGTYLDFEIKREQANNLRAQNQESLERAALAAAQRANVEQGTKRSVFDLELDQELRSVSVDARRENLRQIKAQIASTMTQTEAVAAQTAVNLRESLERVLQMRASRAHTDADRQRIFATIENIKKDSAIKQLDIDMREAGYHPNAPAWVYMVGMLLDRLGITPTGTVEKGKKWFEGKKWINRGLFLGGPFNKQEFPFFITK